MSTYYVCTGHIYVNAVHSAKQIKFLVDQKTDCNWYPRQYGRLTNYNADKYYCTFLERAVFTRTVYKYCNLKKCR